MFSEKYIDRIISEVHIGSEKVQAIRHWQEEINAILKYTKKDRPTERDLHEQFFTDVFEKVLGFQKKTAGQSECTLRSEYVTDVDKTRPDGVLGFFDTERSGNDVRVVIELKSPGVNLDLLQNHKQNRCTPVDQAFSYAHKYDNVEWIIVSNYNEVRLYKNPSSKYVIKFDLRKLADNQQQQKLFCLLLSKENLIRQDGTSKTTHIFLERKQELKQISDEFYEYYKTVRLSTARHILEQQAEKDVEKSVFMSQTILDRFLFIAFLEDLKLIPQDTISEAYVQSKYRKHLIWENFKSLFEAMNIGEPAYNIPHYNGGLFRKNKDIQKLKISDAIMEQYKILHEYDFSSDLSVKILGHVFEKSINDLNILKAELRGKEIRNDRQHDEGAYYTPDVVTDYIISNTFDSYLAEIRTKLGFAKLPELKPAWLEEKKNQSREKHIEFWQSYSEELKKIKIVDPSCGSGAFLVSAFDYLVEEGNRINKELINLHAPILLERWDIQILKNNLFGVDKIEEAAEITKLSLWLKIAKNKDKLISLDDNVKVADAVAGRDWSELFPDVMAEGGFDIVIGNPPYLRQELIQDLKPALEQRFNVYAGRADLYIYFYELGYNILKQGGWLGYITSNKWMRTQYGKKLRKFIKESTTINCLVDLADRPLFEDAVTYTNILTFRKQAPSSDNVMIIRESPFFEDEATSLQSKLSEHGYHLHGDPLFHVIWQKMEQAGIPLGEWETIKIGTGVKTGANEAFIIDDKTKEQLIKQDSKSMEIIKPLLRGEDVQRWHGAWQDQWIILANKGIDIETYPAIKKHLSIYKEELQKRTEGKNRNWYELEVKALESDYEKEKIIYPDIADKSNFSIEKEGYLINNVVHTISGDSLPYLSAILNSDLVFWYILNASPNIRGGFARFIVYVIKSVPIPQLSKAEQKPFIELSEQLHNLTQQHYQIANSFTELLQAEFNITKLGKNLENWHSRNLEAFLKALDSKKIKLLTKQKDEWQERFNYRQQEIIKLNEQITQAEQKLNDLVYKLYNLNQEEINFIKVNF